MKIWNDFCKVAEENLDASMRTDEELVAILREPIAPTESTDEFGRPLPGSAVICQHPDIANYKRIIKIRKDVAAEKGEADYVAYADRVEVFLSALSETGVLFVVLISTHVDLYECLFAPELGKILIAPFKCP